mgnify:CR=1 FL=1
MYVNSTVTQVDYFADKNLDELSEFFETELDDAGNTVNKIVNDTIIGVQLDEVIKIVSFVSNLTIDFVTNGKNNATFLLDTLNQDVSAISAEMDETQQSIENIYNDPQCIQACKNVMDNANIKGIVSTIQQALGDNTVITGIISAMDNIIIENSTICLLYTSDAADE